MSRRIRHLNPAQCGAQIALDARFLSGIADGADVSTWTSRAVATITASQGTLANRPLYRLSGINGQPAVDFDGSNDIMSLSAGANTLTRNAASCDILCPALKDGNTAANSIAVFFSTGDSTSETRLNLTTRVSSVDNVNGSTRRLDSDASATVSGNAGTINSPSIAEVNARWSTGTINSAVNGVKGTDGTLPSSGSTSNITSLASNLGALPASSVYLDGRLGAVVVAVPAFSAPLRSRVRQSLGFSFRIATH